MTRAIMTFTLARKALSHPLSWNAIKPLVIGSEVTNIRVVAGRPAPPGR